MTTHDAGLAPTGTYGRHPDFPVTDDTDIDVQSHDGVLFAVSSRDLRRASESLDGPEPAPTTSNGSARTVREVVRMPEDYSEPLAVVLKLIRAEQPKTSDLPTVKSVREAMALAHKHNMDHVSQSLDMILRQRIFPGGRTPQPLLAYAVTCQFNWTTDRAIVLRQCLSIRLDKDAIADAEMNMADLLHLLALRRDRVQHFRTRLDASTPGGGSPFAWANRAECSRPTCRSRIPPESMALWFKFQHLVTWRFADVPDLQKSLRDPAVRDVWQHLRTQRCGRCTQQWWLDMEEELATCILTLPT